jgi:ferritin-like metal-binding protein YciE
MRKGPILTATVASGQNISKETDAGPMRNAGLNATAQKNEHYGLASHKTEENPSTTAELG